MLLRKKAVDYEPLINPPHRNLALVDPTNPVVFLDIARTLHHHHNSSISSSSSPEGSSKRFMFELFHHCCPVLCKNFYNFCIGGVMRAVDLRPQPTGYRGTSFTDAVVGQTLVGGDVLLMNGQGHHSALSEMNNNNRQPFIVPMEERRAGRDVMERVRAQTRERAIKSGGLHNNNNNNNNKANPSASSPEVQVEIVLSMILVPWTTTTTRNENDNNKNSDDDDGNSTVEAEPKTKKPRTEEETKNTSGDHHYDDNKNEVRVGCQFRLDVLSGARTETNERDGIVIGRLVCHNDAADRNAAVRELLEVARSIYFERRRQEERKEKEEEEGKKRNRSSSSSSMSLPYIVNCGEM